MIHLPEIWDIIQTRIPRGQWMSLNEIYQTVSHYGNLDDEDFEPQSPNSDLPKWTRNVRNVLQYRKRNGQINWDGEANYQLPELRKHLRISHCEAPRPNGRVLWGACRSGYFDGKGKVPSNSSMTVSRNSAGLLNFRDWYHLSKPFTLQAKNSFFRCMSGR